MNHPDCLKEHYYNSCLKSKTTRLGKDSGNAIKNLKTLVNTVHISEVQ